MCGRYILYAKVGPKGIKALVNGVKDNENLETFWVDGNAFGDKGAKHIGTLIKENKYVEAIGVSSCDIGSKGGRVSAVCTVPVCGVCVCVCAGRAHTHASLLGLSMSYTCVLPFCCKAICCPTLP